MTDYQDTFSEFKKQLGVLINKDAALIVLSRDFKQAEHDYSSKLRDSRNKRYVNLDTLEELKMLHTEAYNAQQELATA